MLIQKSTHQTDVQRVAECCESDTNEDAEWAGELHGRKGNRLAYDGERTVIITQDIDQVG